MLEVQNLDVFYGQIKVLKDVSCKVDEGELVVLLGPNGHGKSTLLKTICGLHPSSCGRIIFRGTEIQDSPVHKIVELGLTYVAEDRHLFPEMTVLENLKLGAYNVNARNEESKNLDYVFQLFPILKARKKQVASHLSGGEARMLAVGRGLMSSAKFLGLDEPSLGLAPNIRAEVFNKIAQINRVGISIFLVEANVSQALELGNRIYLMDDGKIVFEGDKNDVLHDSDLKEAFLGV